MPTDADWGVPLLFLQPLAKRAAAYPRRLRRGDDQAVLETVEVAKSRGFRAHEIGGIVALTSEHRTRLLEAWHEYFG